MVKNLPDSAEDVGDAPKRRGSLRFLPPLEVRPSSVAPDPAVRKFTVHMLLKPGLEIFEHYFTSM